MKNDKWKIRSALLWRIITMNHRHTLPLTLRSLIVTRSLSLALLTLFALTAFPFAAHAQSASATLSGTVEDQKGGVVPGVQITLTNTATTLERQVVTSESGSFVVPLLPPGKYRSPSQGAACV